MQSDIEYMTKEGLAKLETELEQLKRKLSELQAERSTAAEIGGNAWHDNFAFEQLEIQERGVRRMISELGSRIRRTRIIEKVDTTVDVIQLGSWVTLRFDGEDGVETYQILGRADSNPSSGIISDKSPLGQALIGARVGERRMYTVHTNEFSFTILNIFNKED